MAAAGSICAALGLAALVGGMLFFGAIMAPLVFTKLPPDVVGPFIRVTFPRYYAFITVAAGFGALGFLLRGEAVSAIALMLVVGLTIWLWFWLIPNLDAMREAGNSAGFARGHSLSVWLNGVELVIGIGMLIRFAVW